jgi:predicted O-methyltransferase YrrM
MATANSTDTGSGSAPDFDSVLASVDEVNGWMTPGQARLLWDSASRLRSGDQIVEIGSFQGRSTTVLAHARPDGVEVVAIDPHAGNDRGPNEIEGFAEEAEGDNARFNANLERAGVRDRVRHVRKMSDAAHSEVEGEIDLLYIDGAHRFGPARDDIRSWGDRVSLGGTMLIHDSFSAVGVTLAQATELAVSGKFRYMGRSESMTEYRRENLAKSDRRSNLVDHLRETPYLAKNLLIKVLITVKLGSLTRFLGHPSGEWPY